ncbi:hypothetical protein JOC37_000278 [Desulfohalotomaculum tongense]|uniref:PQ-loop domain-containing transporter n=1 Tax=Desulforadius tongensis TaxID=1216062 RepID=UPI001956AD76|nr:PQ-loop domain-containing transporter [Desulforadius tongensis]MBM7853913.1 hypothetical protein [Desulforadius tongensis]
MSIFEIIMLTCFGAAWPFAIYKSYTSKSTEGKSLSFLIILLIGYIAGVLHKLFYSYDQVIYLYIINFIMVFIDMILYLRNRKARSN